MKNINLFTLLAFFLVLAPCCLDAAEEVSQAEQEQQEYADRMIVHPDPADDWLFGIHQTISDSVYGTALWFDKFFAVDEVLETTPQTLMRIRLGYEPRARDLNVFKHRFRLKMKLPNLEERVDILLSDEDDSEQGLERKQGQRPSNPEEEDENFTAALRVVNKESADRFIDSRIGISSGDLFAKVRARLLYQVAEQHIFKVQPELYYFLDDGFGSRLLLEYEYNLSPERQLRANLNFRTSEAYSGYRWRNSYYYLQQYDRFRAGAFGVIIYGEDSDERNFEVENYIINYRYRVNAYRRWLYFEVEPFIHFPEEYDYKVTPGIALRVEGYFQNR
ncbi:hypothetical protein [Thalassotalea maritima]|uniref:hypothetical protein n=1 Tax=Thalassotalea maritima TaxID=3242416 RepID=UPI00352727EF